MPTTAPLVSVSTETEQELLRRYWQGDMRAREEVVHRFLPMAKRLAGRYRHTGESQDDLEQVACLGLIKAIDRYDPGLGPFVRYAVPNIMGELKRHFRDKGWSMHVPRSVQERFLQVNDAMDELSGRLGRSPSPKDVAAHTGLELEEVLEALDPAFRALPPREQTILKLRFIDDLTQSEIAEHVGVSQMHVSRLLRRSLDRLNAAAEGHGQPHV